MNSRQDIDPVPDRILSLIYGTTTNPGLWSKFCDSLNDYSSAPIKLVGHDSQNANNIGFLASGWNPDGLDQYQEYYGRLNPWMHMNLAMPVGQVGVSDDALPRSDLLKTEFYNDWLRHQGDLIAGPATMCYRSPDKFVILVAACRKRDVDRTLEPAIALLRHLAPHICRAIGISSTLQAGSHEGLSSFTESRYAIVVVRRSGKTEPLNGRAEQFFRGCGSVRVDLTGKIVAEQPRHSAFFAAATAAMTSQGFSKLPAPLVLHSSQFGQCVVHPHIIPQDVDGQFPQTTWSDPVAGCFIIAGLTDFEQEQDVIRLAQSLGATPAEAKLAGALSGGAKLSDYAKTVGISRQTARNQLQALLHKTGTNSQSGLIRLLLTLASPLSSTSQ